MKSYNNPKNTWRVGGWVGGAGQWQKATKTTEL